jgi:hypothetical protein
VESGDLDPARVEMWHELIAELESLEAGMEAMDRDTERQGNQRARRKAQRRDDRNADDPE